MVFSSRRHRRRHAVRQRANPRRWPLAAFVLGAGVVVAAGVLLVGFARGSAPVIPSAAGTAAAPSSAEPRPGSSTDHSPGPAPPRTSARPQVSSGVGPSLVTCPSYRAYGEAAAAAHAMAVAPPAERAAAGRSYNEALQRLRAALPSLAAEVTTWDRIEARWVAQVQARDGHAPLRLSDGTPFSDPAFGEATSRIEEALARACAPRG